MDKLYLIIESKTGEYTADYQATGKELLKNKKISNSILRSIINDIDVSSADKIKAILEYLYNNHEINQYYQIKLHCINKDVNEFKKRKVEELDNLSFYLDKIETITSEFSYCIKYNNNPVHNWSELFKAIKLTNINRQQKLKDFIIKYQLIAIKKVVVGRDEQVRFYLNPFLLKNSDCVNDYLLDMFKMFIKKNINVNEFVIDLLKLKFE